MTQGFKELRFSKPRSVTPVIGYLMNLLTELDLLFKTKMTLQQRMRSNNSDLKETVPRQEQFTDRSVEQFYHRMTAVRNDKSTKKEKRISNPYLPL